MSDTIKILCNGDPVSVPVEKLDEFLARPAYSRIPETDSGTDEEPVEASLNPTYLKDSPDEPQSEIEG